MSGWFRRTFPIQGNSSGHALIRLYDRVQVINGDHHNWKAVTMTDHTSGTPEQSPTPPSDREIANRFMAGLGCDAKAEFAIEWLKVALKAAQEHKFVSEDLISDLENAVQGFRDADGADELEAAKWEIEGLLSDAETDWSNSNPEADDAMSSIEDIDLNSIEWPNF